MIYPGLAAAAADVAIFSAGLLRRPLRHYQLQAARAILRSIANCQGRVFTVMMARQMGKNELSAQLEAYLLYLHCQAGGALVKAAPTFRPQLVTSKMRLEQLLTRLPRSAGWRSRFGYVIELGAASAHFLSADAESNVVGATASLLLEIDEAQDVAEEKYLRDFRPMAATTNATTVLYGTAWSDDTLLARQRRANLQHDPEAHLEFPYTVLAELNPAYRAFVQAEIRRLGADHPVIQSQYLLQSIPSAGRLFDEDQLTLLQAGGQGESSSSPAGGQGGCHPPCGVRGVPESLNFPSGGVGSYVAGIDIAGESEHMADEALRRVHPHKDSTVVTIARVTRPPALLGDPHIEVVHHYWWTGRDHATQYQALLELLQTRWHCRAVCIDATGIGAGVASWLAKAMPGKVEQLQFTRPAKSDLGYELVAAVNAGRLKMYAGASKEATEFWRQVSLCRYAIAPNAAMNFFVDPRDGHDDFVTSLALTVRAASQALPEPYGVLIRAPTLYNDGPY